jgi:phosphoribosylanthranilate isomerase
VTTKVKICGINSADALAAAAQAGADWVGFVFFPRSPRAVTPAQAAGLSATRPAGPGRVGLFVRPTDAEVAEALAAVPLAALQVYDTLERARELRARFDIPVWYALGVSGSGDLPDSVPGVDALLLDAKPPAGADRPGGNAHPFDWSILRDWTPKLPWLLAGGLTPANVAAAVRSSSTPAVDVSSGVERSPGVKDAELIRDFVAAAKGQAGTMGRNGSVLATPSP